jgi:hypothetical protein
MAESTFELIPYLGGGILEGRANIDRYVGNAIVHQNEQGNYPTRGELKDWLQIPRTTLFDIIVRLDLRKDTELIRVSIQNRKRGRPNIGYKLEWL